MFEDQITLAKDFIERVKRCSREGIENVPASDQVHIDEWREWFDGTERVVREIFGPDSPESQNWRRQDRNFDETVRTAREKTGDALAGYLTFFRTCLALLYEYNSKAAARSGKPASFWHALLVLWPKRRTYQILVVIITGIFLAAFTIWKSLPEKVKESLLGRFTPSPQSTPTLSADQRLTLIEQKLAGLSGRTVKVESLTDEYKQHAEGISDPSPPPPELNREKSKLDADLESAKKQLADYKRLYGDLPHTRFQTQIAQAEQATQAAEKLFPSITLDNAFIERYKNRVTGTTNLLVDKVANRPNPPQNDGDINIAGRAEDLGFVVVAEIMNAASEQEALNIVHQAEGTTKPIALTGVWRIWFEHGGGQAYVQRELMTPAQSTNPLHAFEIHPVTQIADHQLLNSVRVIEGFKAKDAETAFSHFENLSCKLIPTSTTTTLRTAMAGYNYVEFVLEARASIQEIEDGLLLSAKVYALHGDLLVESCRMLFVKDTGPANNLYELKPGGRLHVLGIPRINLAEIDRRVKNAKENPGALNDNLPYEMVIVGIFKD